MRATMTVALRGSAKRAGSIVMKTMIFVVGLLLLVLTASPARADDDDEKDLVEPVRKAIDRGVKYLRSQQHNGNWEHLKYPAYEGGVTALAVLAMLNSGVPMDDAAVNGGLK